MQQQEARAARARGHSVVESCNAVARDGDQLLVAFGSLVVRVEPIGEQGEMQVAFRTGEMMDFQPLDLLLDVFGRGQKRRHGDQRAQMRGNAIRKLQARQQNRRGSRN